MAEAEVGLRIALKGRKEAAAGLTEVDRKLTNVGTAADRAGRLTRLGAGGFDKMASGALRLAKVTGVGLVGALGAASVASVSLANRAIDDQKSQKALALTLRNSTGARHADIASVENWITAQGKALGVTDDDLRPALSKLAIATGSVHKAQKLASLGMDISAGSGKSLSAVTQALAKAQHGSVAGLGKFNVATKDAAGHTLSLSQITDELTKKYQGQAARAADTVAGKFQRVKTQFDETQESIGYKLLPTLNRLGGWVLGPGIAGVTRLWRAWQRNGLDGVTRQVERMTGTQGKLMPIVNRGRAIFAQVATVFKDSLIPALTSLSKGTLKWINPLSVAEQTLGFLAKHATTAKVAFIALATTLTVFKAIEVGTRAWAAAQTILNIVMAASPIGITVLLIAGLVAGVVIAYKKVGWFHDGVNAAFHGISAVVGWTVGFVKDHWKLLLAILTGPVGAAVIVIATHWSQIKDGAGAVVGWIRDRWDGLTNFFSGLPARIAKATRGLFDGIKDAFKSAINWVIGKWNDLSFGIPAINTHIKGIGKIGGFSLNTPNIPMLAAGGPVTPLRPHLVGERGPELFVPHTPGIVIPNQDLANVPTPKLDDVPNFAGAGRDITIRVPVYLDGKMVTEVVLNNLSDRMARR